MVHSITATGLFIVALRLILSEAIMQPVNLFVGFFYFTQIVIVQPLLQVSKYICLFIFHL